MSTEHQQFQATPASSAPVVPAVPAIEVEETYREEKRDLFSGESLFGGFSQILLILWALMVILPFAWMVMTSFKTDPEIIFSPWSLPDSLQWNNFSRAWEEARIGTYFQNTIIVVVSSVGPCGAYFRATATSGSRGDQAGLYFSPCPLVTCRTSVPSISIE